MPIADRAREIASLLEKWRDSFDPSSPDVEEAENQLFRFNLWTSNNFVFESPRASIDWRLRHASVLQSTMEDLLDDLRNSLTGYVFSPTHGTVNLTRKDLATSPEDIEEKLDHLFRFSRAVRRSGILHRFVKLTNYTEYGPDGANLTEDFRMAASRLVEHYLSGSTASQELQDRLVDTISLRQQNFSYLKARKSKQVLKHVEEIQYSSRARSKIAPSLSVTGSLASTVKKKRFVPPEHPVMAERSIMTATTAQYNDASFNYSLQSAPVSGQETEIVGSDWDIPSPPVIPIGRKEWECPYCLLVCSRNEFKGESWKRHILADIMPFVCILDSCPAPSTLFRSSRDWEKHMKYEHDNGSWACMDTSHDEQFLFGNVSDFQNHMHEYHSDQFDEDDLKDIADACFQSRTMNVSLERCPFCHEDQNVEFGPGGLIRHVAQHLLEFARISLAGYNEEENEQSDENSSMNQAAVSSNQFVSGTITDGLKTEFPQGGDDDLESLDAPEISEQPPDTDNTVWDLYHKAILSSEENAANDPILEPFISRFDVKSDSKSQAESPTSSIFSISLTPSRPTGSSEICDAFFDIYSQLVTKFERKDNERLRFAPVGTAKQVLQRDVLLRFFRQLELNEDVWMKTCNITEDDLVRRLDERELHEFLAILIFGHCGRGAALTFTTEVLGKDPWPSDICSLPANREGLMTLFGDERISDRFLENQAYFCPVVIHMGTKGRVDSQDLTRLPYLDEQRIANGTFGPMYRVKIAKGHVYDNRIGTRNQQPIILARKDYVFGKFSAQLHARFDVMEKLCTSDRVCENVIQTFASLVIGPEVHDTYCIFMPFAICNLQEYMMKNFCVGPETAAEKADTILCLKGVAQGLNFLHNGLVTSEGERLHCYNMDLKPSHILIFRDGDNKEIWKLSGFSMADTVSQNLEDTGFTASLGHGQGIFHSSRELNLQYLGLSYRVRRSSFDGAQILRGKGTYLSPEYFASSPMMSATHHMLGDVWSLGCVISVIFAYLEEGADGVIRYQDQRADHRESDGIDWFFILGKGVISQPHPEVKRWHNRLARKATERSRQEGAIVKSILDFLERSVFADERNRCTGREVEQMLQETSILYRELESTPPDNQPTLEERIKDRLPNWLRSRKE